MAQLHREDPGLDVELCPWVLTQYKIMNTKLPAVLPVCLDTVEKRLCRGSR